MEIKELVPSLELCKLIPQGEFEDSAFIWVNAMDNTPKVICRPWDKKSTAAPAPTTDEILDKCKDITGVLNPTLWYQHEWIADCGFDRTGKLSEEFFEDADFKNIDIIEGRSNKNPATAALKLWLKLSDQSC